MQAKLVCWGWAILTVAMLAACAGPPSVSFGDGDQDGADGDGESNLEGELPDSDGFPDGDGACTHLCDCPQGWSCGEDGQCVDTADDEVGTVFCCDNAGCPEGAPCEHRDGGFGNCSAVDADVDGDGACTHLCDCPQGWYCENGACVNGADLVGTVFCCDNAGCPVGAPCEYREGGYGRCSGEDGDADGDGEIFETVCEAVGGQCGDYVGVCPEGMRKAATDLGCDIGICCLPLEEVACYRDGGYCTPNASDSTSLLTCREGFTPADSDLGCDAFGEWCCAAGGPPCIPEGGWGYYGYPEDLDPPEPGWTECCEGLTPASNAMMDENGECNVLPDDSFVCVRCGNDACGPGENYCRCEDDCAKPGECVDNNDCPSTECFDVGAGCLQRTWACDGNSGDCVSEDQLRQELICNFQTGLCEEYVPKCTPLGGVGSYDGACCDGLDQAEMVDEDPATGQCYYYDCACYRCLVLGDGFCDRQSGENTCNSDDCQGQPPVDCNTDDDCPEPQCFDLLGPMPACSYVMYYCMGGACEEKAETMDFAACNYETGMCEPVDQTECAMRGGECIYWQTPCPPESFEAEDHLGCDRSSHCCLPWEMQCYSNEDCGSSYCADLQGGGCQIIYSECANGQCLEMTQSFDDMYCDNGSGQCKPYESTECTEQGGYCSYYAAGCQPGYQPSEDTYQQGCPGGRSALCCLPEWNEYDCESAGGMCIGWGPECPEGTYNDWRSCEYGQCCMPIEMGECGSQGGYCAPEGMECDGGYEAGPSDGCPYDSPTCCLPQTFCRFDEECPAPYCFDLPTDVPRCQEMTYFCNDRLCESTAKTMEMAYCDPDRGGCVPYGETYCWDMGGFCASWTSGCPNGAFATEGSCGDLYCAGGCVCCLWGVK
ncbi:MAG: hypothetical protein C4523_07655 [Myxococcales bacterium]|nr:MAG: hypothetical protein C4523_07655 [Myxococcales bacterium]